LKTPRRPLPKARETGFALILVIWGLVALSSLAAGFALATRHEIRLAHDALQELNVEAAVTRALSFTFLALNRRDPEHRWQADGAVREVPGRPGELIRVRVRAESGKIDINQAPPPVIAGLIRQRLPDRPANALTDALLDWRDSDNDRRPQGAEADDYLAAGHAVLPSNQPFESTDELSRVLGFDAAALAALQPYLTIYSGEKTINAVSADLVTLKAIPGIDPGDAESYVEQRDRIEPDSGGPPFSLLAAGSRFLDWAMHKETISVDIEVNLGNGSIHSRQVIARLGPGNRYRILSSGVPEHRTPPGL